jgi:hypothetical protein
VSSFLKFSFSRILLLQTSKTDNNALDIDAFITSKLEKHNSTHFITKLNAKFPWPSIMPKQRECILHYYCDILGFIY